MADRKQMDDFFSGSPWAVVGVSNDPDKFGSIVHRRLKDRGEVVFPVNPRLDEVGGEPCYRTLADLPEKVGQIVVVVPPGQTRGVVETAIEEGIGRIWMQPGAESTEAVALCLTSGVSVVSGRCILRFMDSLDVERATVAIV